MAPTAHPARGLVSRFFLVAAGIFFLLSSLGLAQGQEQEEAGPRARQEWFYYQRAYPLAHTPPGVRMRALNQKVAMQQQEAITAGETALGINTTSWTLIGPQPTINLEGSPWSTTSGRVNAVAVDSSDATGNTVYIGGAEGGVWKTTNGGTSWAPLTDNQFSLAISSLAIDPNNNQNIYAGTGEENFNIDAYYGGGLLKSANGGSTWTQIGAAYFGGPLASEVGGSYIGGIAIQPVAGATPVLLVASKYSSGGQSLNSGIWRSTDGGNTWARVLPTTADVSSYGTSVFFVSNTIAYAAIGNLRGDSNNGVYKSTNAGLTWAPANGSGSTGLITGANAGRITLVAAPSSPSTLYAAIASNVNVSSGLAGMFKSTDGGTTWNAIATPLGTGGNGSTSDFCGDQCWYDMPVAVSPANASLLYVGGSYNYNLGNGGIYMSTNAGGAWSSVNPGTLSGEGIHPDFHALAFANGGQKLYVGDDGGMWSTTQVGTTSLSWNNLNATLAITQFYPGLSISAGSAGVALDGTQDNGTQLYSGSSSWQTVTCGDGAWTAIDPANSNTMWSGCTPQNAYVLKSTNGGTTWNSVSSGINTGDPVAFIPPLVMDLKNPQTLYFGTNRVWQTTNGASPFWTPVSSPLTNGSASAHITVIAVSPVSSTNLFAGTSNNLVWYTTNTGTNWTQITSGLPPRYPTMVQGDPQDGTTFYITFSGFSGFGDSLGHVFKCSTNTGSCSDISSNLPNIPANDIVIDPTVAGSLYLATDIGVFKTTNSGGSWSTFSNGLPNVAVVGLKLHSASRTLRAATHGRSAWDISLSSTPTQQTLTVTLAGTGMGVVTSDPAGIACPSTCATGFATGTVVTLMAGASTGSVFGGWGGACGGTGSCSVTMNSNEAVTATFNPAGTPTVTTTAATLITSTGGTINGLANANNTATNAWFEWGTSSTLASFTQTGSASISGTSTWYIWFVLTGLSPGTTYYYRIAASNSAGTVKGSILNFTPQAKDASGALQFIPIAPCRVADTRNVTGPFGGPALGGQSSRDFVIPNSACGILPIAAAYSLNVTAVPHGSLGYITVWPSGQSQPLVSTLNSYDGRVKANEAIVPAGTNGAIRVFATDTTDVVLDMNGYFVPAPDPSALAFYPLPPCRIADTRNATGQLGGPSLAAQQVRTFPVRSSSCNIPATAQAYSLNFTAVPQGPLGYLTIWPTGLTQPLVSTLNAPTGTVTANAAIVPAGTGGAITAYVTNNTDLVIDIDGYFAPPAPGGQSLYTLTPCRVVDTRNTSGAFNGKLAVDVKDSSCGALPSAQAFVVNATVVPAGSSLGYLTLWPDGQTQPLVSTLNALDGVVTSNMAIVPTANGSIDAFSTNATQLVLDINGFLAP